LRSCLLIGSLLATPNVETGVGIYLMLSLAQLCCFEVTRHEIPFGIDPAVLLPLLRRGGMLGAVMFLQALQVSIPRIVLDKESNSVSLGVLATLSVILQSGNLVMSAYAQSALPRLGRHSGEELIRFVAKPGLLAAAL